MMWMAKRICRDVVGKEAAEEVEAAVEVVGETVARQRSNVVVDVDEAVELVEATVAGRRGGGVGGEDEAARVVEEVKQMHKNKMVVEGVVQEDEVGVEEGEVVVEEGEAVVEVKKRQRKKKRYIYMYI